VVALRSHKEAVDALDRLAGALEALEFGPDGADLAAERDRIAGTVRNYLIPRATEPDVPITIVFAGPTGSGKSTLINSVIGEELTRTGVLRPTTRSPVVLAPERLASRFASIAGVPCHVISVSEHRLGSTVLIDSPDIDSTSTRHRAMAETLIDNADIVVFVTSALRYADDVPWQVLRRALAREAPVLGVLNRVGSATAGAIVDFKSRLSAAGLPPDLITVGEHHLAEGIQRVPDLAIRSLRKRLGRLIDEGGAGSRRLFSTVLSSTLEQTRTLMRSLSEIEEELDDLEAELSVYLADRQTHLDITGLGSGFHPDLGDQPTGRTVRRWRKRFEGEPLTVTEIATEVGERLRTLIESDIRNWLIDERDMLSRGNVDRLAVTEGVANAARSAGEGWVRFVARIVTDQGATDPAPGTAVLVHAATVNEVPPEIDVLFGSEGPTLVERARRELAGRQDVVYQLAGSLVVEELRGRLVDFDETGLMASLGAVSAFAPVDA
jgi:energy-coupling factor transporter ATP-binding protein EcfA2